MNKQKAVKWFRKAAEQGDADAQNFLGLCYLNGDGVSINEQEAERLFRLAVQQDHGWSMYNLGTLLCDNAAANHNQQLAREGLTWLRKAKEMGIEEAQEAINNAWDPDRINPALLRREPTIGEKIGDFLGNLFS